MLISLSEEGNLNLFTEAFFENFDNDLLPQNGSGEEREYFEENDFNVGRHLSWRFHNASVTESMLAGILEENQAKEVYEYLTTHGPEIRYVDRKGKVLDGFETAKEKIKAGLEEYLKNVEPEELRQTIHIVFDTQTSSIKDSLKKGLGETKAESICEYLTTHGPDKSNPNSHYLDKDQKNLTSLNSEQNQQLETELKEILKNVEPEKLSQTIHIVLDVLETKTSSIKDSLKKRLVETRAESVCEFLTTHGPDKSNPNSHYLDKDQKNLTSLNSEQNQQLETELKEILKNVEPEELRQTIHIVLEVLETKTSSIKDSLKKRLGEIRAESVCEFLTTHGPDDPYLNKEGNVLDNFESAKNYLIKELQGVFRIMDIRHQVALVLEILETKTSRINDSLKNRLGETRAESVCKFLTTHGPNKKSCYLNKDKNALNPLTPNQKKQLEIKLKEKFNDLMNHEVNKVINLLEAARYGENHHGCYLGWKKHLDMKEKELELERDPLTDSEKIKSIDDISTQINETVHEHPSFKLLPQIKHFKGDSFLQFSENVHFELKTKSSRVVSKCWNHGYFSHSSQGSLNLNKKVLLNKWCARINDSNETEAPKGCRKLVVAAFRPGCISPEQFVHIIETILNTGEYSRVMFDSTALLPYRFPMLHRSELFIPSLVRLFKSKELVSIFLDPRMVGVPSQMQASMRNIADYVLTLKKGQSENKKIMDAVLSIENYRSTNYHQYKSIVFYSENTEDDPNQEEQTILEEAKELGYVDQHNGIVLGIPRSTETNTKIINALRKASRKGAWKLHWKKNLKEEAQKKAQKPSKRVKKKTPPKKPRRTSLDPKLR